MTIFELYIENFQFDAWANRKWLHYLDSCEIGDPDRGIFGHLLGVQELWYQRCLGNPPGEVPQIAQTVETIEDLERRWIAILEERTDNPLIHFRRFDGEPMHQSLGRIAHHVLDHGTYHRGELRGLCRARGDDRFPETGLFLYHRELGLES